LDCPHLWFRTSYYIQSYQIEQEESLVSRYSPEQNFSHELFYGGPPHSRRNCQCSITCLAIEKFVRGLTTEKNKEAKKKEERIEDVQKDDMLQPITKTNSKLDKELQEWEVESTKGGANDGGG
jgi:hypothetical protein